MTQEIITEPVASPGAAESPTQTALSDAENDAALLAELGVGDSAPEEESPASEETKTDPEKTSEDETPVAEGEDLVNGRPEADADADETEEAEDDSPEALTEIPEELHEKVGAIVKKARDKARAKAEEYKGELEELRESTSGQSDEVERLTNELTELRAEKSAPAYSEANPYADVTTTDALNKIEDELWDLRQELMAKPESFQIADPSAEGGKRTMTEVEQRKRLAVVDKRLQRDLPARKQWLTEARQKEAEVGKVLPDLAKRGSPLSRAVNEVLAKRPEVKAQADYREVAVQIALGQSLLKKHGKDAWAIAEGKKVPPAEKPKSVTKPPPVPKTTQSPARSPDPARNAIMTDEEFAAALRAG
ncbi:MAG: hypothetical protein AAGJ81_10690 [Verrucomicrobiota bacterium]